LAIQVSGRCGESEREGDLGRKRRKVVVGVARHAVLTAEGRRTHVQHGVAVLDHRLVGRFGLRITGEVDRRRIAARGGEIVAERVTPIGGEGLAVALLLEGEQRRGRPFTANRGPPSGRMQVDRPRALGPCDDGSGFGLVGRGAIRIVGERHVGDGDEQVREAELPTVAEGDFAAARERKAVAGGGLSRNLDGDAATFGGGVVAACAGGERAKQQRNDEKARLHTCS
jgi:hypothetical protein